MIGAEPHTQWLEGSVRRDDSGFVLTGRELYRAGEPPAGWPLPTAPLLLETSMPGVFAAGDVRHRSVKRVASAVGEGAIAIQLLHEYLRAEKDDVTDCVGAQEPGLGSWGPAAACVGTGTGWTCQMSRQ